MIELGADVDSVDLDNVTPLHWAAMQGQVDMVRALVEEHGADLNGIFVLLRRFHTH